MARELLQYELLGSNGLEFGREVMDEWSKMVLQVLQVIENHPSQ